MTLAFVGRLIFEFVQFSAVVLISYGAWLAYEPAGFIVGGILLLAGTILPVAGKR